MDNKTFKWQVHLAKSEPGKCLICQLIILAVFLTGYFAGSMLFGIVMALAVTLACAEFLFPVKYEINSEYASQTILFRKNTVLWSNVKKCYIDDYGIKLSTLGYPTRLEAFRGLYLRFADNAETVTQLVEKYAKHES